MALELMQQPATSDSVAERRLDPQPKPTRPTPGLGDRTVSAIIASARAEPAPVWGAWLMSCLFGGLSWASYFPLNWGWVGWLSIVPLVLLVRLARPTRWMYAAIFGGSLLSMLATLQWMRLGDVSMYPAWFALSLYMAMYPPAFVAVSRLAVHRLRIPLTLAVPAVWVGLEYARAYLMTGFSWYYLGHTQHRWIELIQISDLVGAYGVSFVVAATAACLGGLLPTRIIRRLGLDRPGHSDGHVVLSRRWLQAGLCAGLVLSCVAYGVVRRGQGRFEAGPRVALVQGNFPTSMKHDPDEWGNMFRRHDYLTGRAVQYQPDLIVWPESMFRWPLFTADADLTDAQLRKLAPEIPSDRWRDPLVTETLREMSQKAGAALVIGIEAFEADSVSMARYNSAAFIRPDVGLAGRYDKLHRVPFGEYVPLQEELPWLQKFTPIPARYGLKAGHEPKAFAYGQWRVAPVICFEDTVPHLVRKVAKETAQTKDGWRPIDLLVNLTNDGWFNDSCELDQHLVTSVFRCVECRVPMVRAVNTGISAVIDGDGVVREPEVFIDADEQGRNSMRDPRTGVWHRGLDAVLVDTVPLDSRSSLYVATGDWFAASCLGLTLVSLFLGPWFRWQASTPEKPAAPAETSADDNAKIKD